MNPENEPFPEDEFLVTGSLWFVAWGDRTNDARKLVSALVRAEISGGTKHPLVFTDKDSAYIYAEQIAKAKNADPPHPFTFPTLDEFTKFLGILSQQGVEALGFDPFGDRVRVFPIERILDGIRNHPH